jgi:dipeptide transport system permease protein
VFIVLFGAFLLTLLVITAIAVVYSPFFSRVVRGPVLAERGKEYVEAAKPAGAGDLRIMFRDRAGGIDGKRVGGTGHRG